MGQHGVKLFTLPDHVITINPQFFLMHAAKENVTDEDLARSLSLKHNLLIVILL